MKLDDFLRLIKAYGFTESRGEELGGEPMIYERKSPVSHQTFRIAGYMNNEEPEFEYYRIGFDLCDGYVNDAETKCAELSDVTTQIKYWGVRKEKESKVLQWYDDTLQKQTIVL